MVLVDPVMGDNGRCLWDLYRRSAGKDASAGGKRPCDYAQSYGSICFFYMGKKGWKKDMPGLLELDGRKRLEQIGKIGEQLKKEYGLQAAVITGVESQAELCVHQMGNLVVENGHSSWCFAPKIGGSYSGTGDLFASVLSAGLVKEMSMMSCVELAVNFLSKAIAQTVQEGTDRNDGVCFEAYLGELCKS